SKIHFKDCADRHIQLLRFINFYNTVKPHKSLNNATPYLISINLSVNNSEISYTLRKQPLTDKELEA
ncbi:integrase core domain-containing protein, partial [Nitrosomonas sp.]|uniref:integrase core domain-containing protein n=1 Tax=Nitrosomonas sp. TaxID=42353 RepID=UPI0032ED2FDE